MAKKHPGPVVVWWYGPIFKNAKAASVPHVLVEFRELDSNGEPDGWYRQRIALGHLGLLSIGTVWRAGVRESRVERSVKTFDVSFNEGDWSCVTAGEAGVPGLGSSASGGYELYFAGDRAPLLGFRASDGRRLLVPCMEYFVKCFGHSAEVKRVLATYPWEEAERRLFKPPNEEDHVEPGTWAVNLAKRMRNDDVVFLAHVKYDAYARSVAKSIYSQAEAAFSASTKSEPYAFIKAVPWFRGPAQLKVRGVPLDDGRTFLGLSILGASQPHGSTVIRDRENPGGTAEPDGPGSGPTEPGRTHYEVKPPPIVDLTSNNEPDHGSSSIEIDEDDFEVLGEPREVFDRRHAVEHGLVRHKSRKDERGDASTGEPYGSGKGVDYASIHAPIALESHGMLRDMWDAACRLRRSHPNVVRSVAWFTFEDGFSETGDPRLIAVEPFATADKGTPTSTRHWVYHDVAARTPRGVLVMRIVADTETAYVFEIQRRLLERKTTEAEAGPPEESFRGLVFTLNRNDDLYPWIRRFLNEVRSVKGVVYHLAEACPGTAYAFKHASGSHEAQPGEMAIRNALGKVGITVPTSKRESRGNA